MACAWGRTSLGLCLEEKGVGMQPSCDASILDVSEAAADETAAVDTEARREFYERAVARVSCSEAASLLTPSFFSRPTPP